MFSSIPVAANAVVQVGYIFVFLCYLGTVMLVALVAIISGIIIGWMAQVALIIGSLVVHRECMGHIDWLPGSCFMAN